jgi:hypothetical protein
MFNLAINGNLTYFTMQYLCGFKGYRSQKQSEHFRHAHKQRNRMQEIKNFVHKMGRGNT